MAERAGACSKQQRQQQVRCRRRRQRRELVEMGKARRALATLVSCVYL